MDLEKLAAEIRPRQPYEAIDLGIDLGRAFWRPLWGSWFATVVVAWLLILWGGWSLGVPLWLLVFAIWWLKPVWDRVPLFVLSRSLFGSPPTVLQIVREVPRLWWRNLFWALTAQRFDVRRAFSLPVWELEGLKGKPRRKRLEVLRRGQENPTTLLTFAGMAFEQLLALGFVVGAFMLVPDEWGLEPGMIFESLFSVEEEPLWSEILTTGTYLLAISLVEPLYVAGGFGLYLNRRILLEGWDIQLAFQRLARRIDEEGKGKVGRGARKAGTAAVLALCVGLGALAPGPALAQAPVVEQDGSRDGPDPAEVIEEVLKEPEFGYYDEESEWVRRRGVKGPEFEGPDIDMPDLDMGEIPWWNRGLLENLGTLIWIVAGAFLVWGVILLVRHRWGKLLPFLGGKKTGPAAPQVILGLDVRPESLPADVAGDAQRLWDQGKQVECLSLLYRGALAKLVTRYRLGIDESATEGDCLSAVERVGGPEAYFGRLTRGWQQVAYAARSPGDDEVAQLCQGWRVEFARQEPPA